MKLAVVLMLTALPLYCYAGSGCEMVEYVIGKSIDPAESKSQYIADLQQFIPGERTASALRKFKQCFLDQSNETLSNIFVMMDAIYDSELCASY
ncbi:mammaglobin-A-like isoform X2 [Eptesicus fuscus]|uniref:mammaglobin-A-like isoform X2 n=1 Tax=Eptesicus fuscus TaxID=29078 RepID=UPI00240459AD|nr:mammaglobin-A-like isoform X2 [Eptesicus fuscus]